MVLTVNSTEGFSHWLETSTPGSVIIYHTGFLGVDRFKNIINIANGVPIAFEVVPEIRDKALAAIEAFEQNKVHLYQRKISDMVYQYIAQKRSKYQRNW